MIHADGEQPPACIIWISVLVEELDDLVDGERHVVGILDRVIGSLDGEELDDVVLGEGLGVFEGDHLVFRAVQDHHRVGDVEVLVVERAEGFEVVEESLVDFHGHLSDAQGAVRRHPRIQGCSPRSHHKSSQDSFALLALFFI